MRWIVLYKATSNTIKVTWLLPTTILTLIVVSKCFQRTKGFGSLKNKTASSSRSSRLPTDKFMPGENSLEVKRATTKTLLQEVIQLIGTRDSNSTLVR